MDYLESLRKTDQYEMIQLSYRESWARESSPIIWSARAVEKTGKIFDGIGETPEAAVEKLKVNMQHESDKR